MRTCPLCQAEVKPADRVCPCGEILAPWRNLTFYADTLRQRGLVLARQEDYLGACLAFLVAAVSNPLDRSCLADVVRALVRMGRWEEAREFLALLPAGTQDDQHEALAEAVDAGPRHRRPRTVGNRATTASPRQTGHSNPTAVRC